LSKIHITVLLVDDFEPFRVLISSLLRKKPELQIIAEASDGVEAVQKSRQFQPDVIPLDIGRPKLNGIEAARQIREVAAHSKIIFVTQEISADLAQEAIGLGAMGYVAKTRVGTDLIQAIEASLQGKLFIRAGLAGRRGGGHKAK
jgi:DNA-binding NarL/FixJ family response regulator